MNAEAAASPGEQALLMVVEDDDLLREALAETLAARGFRVCAYPTGDAAWTALHEREPPDAIVLDLIMPGMDGREFRRRQLDDHSLASIPVVAISGDRSCNAANVGADAFLAKPLTSAHVVSAIELVLRKRRRRARRPALHHTTAMRRRSGVRRSARSLAEEVRAEHREALLLRCVALGLSHVVNNTLQGVMSYLQAMLEKTDEDETHRVVFDAAVRCADLLREFAACTGNSGAGTQTPPPLGPIEPVLIEAWRPLVPAQVELRVTAVHLLRGVHAGTNAVVRMTCELIRNALEALGQDRGRIHVCVALEQRRPATLRGALPAQNRRAALWCVLAVSDDGPGIPECEIELIWKPFYTTRFPGRGLGLATVLSQMKSLGGLVEAESKMGVGTTIRLLFPLAAATEEEGTVEA